MNSMTGFGRSEFRVGRRTYRLELRSYNNRFLDAKVRLPWGLGELERRTLAALRARISRGRVEASVWEEDAGDDPGSAGPRLDEAVAAGMARTVRRLAEIVGCDLATAALLVPPVKELYGTQLGGADADEVWQALGPAVDTALDRLLEMRAAEGQAMARDLTQHVDSLDELRRSIAERTDGEPARQRERLEARLAELLGGDHDLDPARLAHEIALIADRCDVSEELTRLSSHLEQLRGILGRRGPTGRRIEFLLQELNRELTTIGSKTLSAGIAHLVVEGKAAVEKLREQAQNVE